jgi:hypothetical protein
MFGKLLLPFVGATPAAWTTCLLFFQVALLAGYAYAHGVRLPPLVHVGLVALAILALPVGIRAGSAPPPGDDPTLWILGRLAVGVGAPFLVLAATAPLLQRWYPGEPYPLYAASNAGSFVALLAYPLVIEPRLALAEQTRWFGAGYLAFVAAILVCAAASWKRPPVEASAAVPTSTWLRWLALAFVPSSLMIGATTYVSTDLAAIPLLWIVPLALYLASFVIVFARPGQPPPRVVSTGFVVLLLPLYFLVLSPVSSGPGLLFAHMALLFLAALLFHGELVRLAPPRAQLTRFYLALALGGALGGLWNTLAPWIFTGITEYPLTMVLGLALLPRRPPRRLAGERQRELLRSVGIDPDGVAGLERDAAVDAAWQRQLDVVVPLATTVGALAAGYFLVDAGGAARAATALGLPIVLCAAASLGRPHRLALGLCGVLLAASLGAGQSDLVRFRDRSFFGTLRVEDQRGVRSLVHGTIIHGQQSLDPGLRREPIAYYHRSGPIGAVFADVDARWPAARVAVLGLGTGALAAYGRSGDAFDFFEIDAAVERVARDPRLFTWLADTPATVRVVLGDARLTLARTDATYELIMADAFSSHAIPMHLVTREALAMYVSRLAPGGLVVFHISSPYLRLDGPLGALARESGMVGVIRRDEERGNPLKVPSTWVVVARTGEDLAGLSRDPRWQPLPPVGRAWTDDFSDLLGALAF